MTDTPHVRLEMLSNPLYLCGARELVSAVAKRLSFDETACCQIALAVDEALCNVIRHGYDRQTNRPIWLSIYPQGPTDRPEGMLIVIEDEARQVEPDAIRGRDLEDIRPGGLGVHIMKQVMDEVRYEKRGPVGMRLTLLKKIGSPSAACASDGESAKSASCSGCNHG